MLPLLDLRGCYRCWS